MLDFIFDFKQTIIKYKKQLLTFSLIPVFMFRSSLPGFAAEVSPDAKNEWFLLPFNQFYIDIPNGSYSSKYVSTFDNVNGTFYNTSVQYNGSRFRFLVGDVGAVMPEFHSNHEYLLYYTLSFVSPSPTTFAAIAFDGSISGAGNINLISVSQTSGYFDSTNTLSGFFRFSGDAFFTTESQIYLRINSQFDIGPRVSYAFYVLDITDSSDSEVNQIVTAINNQTNNIMNAGSGFGGTTSGILSGNDELSGFIDDYTQIEQSMYDKFSENQTAVIGNFSGFSWGSLSTAVDWTSDYLNKIYDNSGDFRTMFMYPILAGIALIFIGRQGLTSYIRSRRDK